MARTAAALDLARQTIDTWMEQRLADPRMKRFAAHLVLLAAVLAKMADAVAQQLQPDALPDGSGARYVRCRELESSISVMRRTFEWYAAKYDQRLEGVATAEVLLAADEVIRSCWTEPFAALGRKPPSGPLAYLDSRFDAWATPRVSPPPDLRAPADAIVAEFVREMPIPTIALPWTCIAEPWWLVLAVHETGHHVQKDLDGQLESATRAALASAVADAALAADWRRWSLEAFADAFSVLMVGPAAAWAVDEIVYAPAAALVTAPEAGDRYPPRLVRLALLSEVAQAARFATPGPGADELGAWVTGLTDQDAPLAARKAVQRHLAVVPDVARALTGLPIGSRSLVEACSRAEWFAPGDRVWSTATQLLQPKPLVSQQNTRPAARVGVAAGVRAYVHSMAGDVPATASTLDRLRNNLVSVLVASGEPGTLAGDQVPPADDGLAARLAARCLEAGVGQGA